MAESESSPSPRFEEPNPEEGQPKYSKGPITIHVGATTVPGEIKEYNSSLGVYVVLTRDESNRQQESFVRECFLSPVENVVAEENFRQDDQSAHIPIPTEQEPTISGRKPMTENERSQMERLLKRIAKR